MMIKGNKQYWINLIDKIKDLWIENEINTEEYIKAIDIIEGKMFYLLSITLHEIKK